MERFWEIDALKSLAIALMIFYHFFFDLNYFGIAEISLYGGIFFLIQRFIAITFISLAGVNTAISYSRLKDKGWKSVAGHFGKKAFFLAAAALLITAATFIYPHNGFIVFGIIHFLAAAVLLSAFFAGFRYLNLVLGIILIAAGPLMEGIVSQTPFLLWLGIKFPGFYTLDYYPLIPWLGFMLIGIFIGKTLYPNGERAFKLKKPEGIASEIAEKISKNSLAIYLIHQPVLVALILAATYVF